MLTTDVLPSMFATCVSAQKPSYVSHRLTGYRIVLLFNAARELSSQFTRCIFL